MSRPAPQHGSAASRETARPHVDPHAPIDAGELARCFAGTRRLASAMLGAESLGEDAAQDVIVAALQRPPRVERGLAAWFAGALKRRILHLRRGRARRMRHEAQTRDERRVPEPHEALARAEIQERLVAAVRALPEPYRAPVLLHYLEEHDTRAVAERLDRPLSTVQTQLQRGLALLRERFGADERARRNDWRDALAILCVPHPGAIRARIDAVERSLAPRGVGRNTWLAPLGAAASVAALAILLLALREDPAGEVAVEPALARASSAAPVASNPGGDAGDAPVRESVASAPPASSSPAEPGGERANDARARSLELVVRSASTRAPLAGARAYVDRSPSPRVSSTPRDEDRARAVAADAHGAIALELAEPPCWVRVECAGHVGALLRSEGVHDALDVELDAACVLEVVAERDARLLAAKAWRPSVFPVATPPYELANHALRTDGSAGEAERSGADGEHAELGGTIARLELAAGRYVVSALCERGGGRLVDAALIELAPGAPTVWTALDAREIEIELALSRAPSPDQRWTAALLLGGTGQLGAVATGRGDARLRWRSVPPGEHQLVLALDGAEISRRPMSISLATPREVLVELPRAELTVELEVADGAPAMCMLHGPLERPRAARRTYTVAGPRASFAALPPGRYEAWLRTPRGFGRSELALRDGAQHLALREEQAASARLHYRGECALERLELVLVAESGARLPITFGSFGDAARARGFTDAALEPSTEDGSVTVAVPPGEYELLCTVDGESRLPQRVRLAPGGVGALGPSAVQRDVALTLTRAGRPIARQAVELAGTANGATPLDPAPGALWMYSVVTDDEGRVALPLAAAHWTALLAGGALVEFDVGATTGELRLAFPLAHDAAR